jgi:hypothetical protein
MKQACGTKRGKWGRGCRVGLLTTCMACLATYLAVSTRSPSADSFGSSFPKQVRATVETQHPASCFNTALLSALTPGVCSVSLRDLQPGDTDERVVGLQTPGGWDTQPSASSYSAPAVRCDPRTPKDRACSHALGFFVA